MSRKHLCFDIDNVVAQTDEVMRRIIYEYTGGRVNLSYESIVEFDYWKCKDASGNSITKKEWTSIHNLFAEPENLLTIQPVSGVKEYMRLLSKKYMIHFVTSRLPKARRTTIEWLDAQAFPLYDIHFLQHREKHESLGKFEAVVEDDYDQALAFANVETQCYLIKRPWNAGRPSHSKLTWVDGWTELISKLI